MHEDLGPSELLDLDILAVGIDAGDGELLFRRRQEPEGALGVVGEVDHPEVRREADDGGDEALHQEHVSPAREPAPAVQLVEPEIDDAARGQDDDLAHLQEREARLLLSARIPRRDQVRQAGVDAARRGAEQHAQGDHLLPGPDEGGRQGDDAEREGDEGEPEPGAEGAHGQRRRQLERDGADGEDEDGDAEAVPRQAQVRRQRGYRGGTDDARVQQVQRAQKARDRAQAQVDLEAQTPLEDVVYLDVRGAASAPFRRIDVDTAGNVLGRHHRGQQWIRRRWNSHRAVFCLRAQERGKEEEISGRVFCYLTRSQFLPSAAWCE